MSDHEEVIDNGYETPVPELDDHRHQPASIHREERPRRGTFDSQYGSRRRLDSDASRNAQPHPAVRVRDFEEAVIDDDGGEISPIGHRPRRGTVDTTTSSREPSPPNSVKAFALARRPPALSFSEQRPDLAELQRTTSVTSHRSKTRTARDSDVSSVKTNRSAAEDDVCFPHENRDGPGFYIDFEYLEDFIRSQKLERVASKLSSNVRQFTDQREEDGGRTQVVTADGDIIEIPSGSSIHEEKVKQEPTQVVPDKSPPQRFSFFSSAWDQTIHAADMEDLALPGEEIRNLFSFPNDGEDYVWWLNVNCPTDDEVRAICKAFGIHPLTVEDITTQEAREKIELFKSYYFANFRSYTAVYDEDGNREFEPFNMFVIVFREGILSFSHTFNSHASEVRRRISTLKDYVDLSADWICYAIIDNIVDNFGPAITEVQNAADVLDDDVYRARPDDEDRNPFLPRLARLRQNIMGLMRLLGGKADVLKGFTKRCNENYQVTPRMEVGLYLGDIQDHVVTMMNTLGHLERILQRAHSNYLAQLSIDSITQGTRANKVLSKITFLASIIVPLNVVTGLFGMNVPVPFGVNDGSLAAFFTILGILIAFSVICIVLARRLRYI
ncbi:Putative metal ion transporter C27B12.12c [Cytospora mali]|uniref:Metal ion transporter C27B12.12c n=1 Tax=Cytospora mali TaxID=578113 RepID=A0A194VM31_CYTMA|nr:Putative metal ion transporter C27B12.12c [Valsa mali]